MARPGTAAVPADKGAVVVQPGSNGQPKGNEYIAGPFGSGRLSQDGECSHAAAAVPVRALDARSTHACCAAPCTIPFAEGYEDILEVPTIRHLLEAR